MITLNYIPKIDEMLACLCDSKFVTSLDSRSGYYHIKLCSEMRYKSAFITFGKYEFLRMPFGLAQGLAFFNSLMQKVFGQFSDFDFFHMDDVLVHDSHKNDHSQHLKMIFHKIREAGLKIKLPKCAFSTHSEHIMIMKGKDTKSFLSITYVSGAFIGSQKN